MRFHPVRHVALAVVCAAVLLSLVPASPVPASAAYSRRIAIAPFVSLAKEDIGPTVSVLPRLLASRLMALAGADVVLLPAGGKAPEEQAKEAKVPLLLQGTVSKLGKGYSVDTTVIDLETGKPAGAFFAAAATEDDIIAQLGVLSGEIAEKMFGIQGAIRATALPAPAPVAAPAAAGIPAIGGPPVAPPQAPISVPTPAAPAPSTLTEGWIPSSLKKVGQSDKIADEIFGVVSGDVDPDGNGEVFTWSRNTIYIYRVKGNDVLPYTRISRGVQHHFLNVEAVDLDGDGKKDLVVTDLEGDRLASFVLLRKKDGFVETPGTTKHHLVLLRDWNGKNVVAGQRQGFTEAFQGKIYAMKWDGKALSEGEPLPLDTAILPVSAGGVYSLSPWRSGKDPRWLYVDVEEKLRILDAGGKSAYKSKQQFGGAADAFEYGEYSRLEGRYPALPLRRAPRAVASREASFVVVTSARREFLRSVTGASDTSGVVILQSDGSGFTERAASPKSDFFYSGVDLLPPGGMRRGGGCIASVIEQTGSAFKDRVSRLVLLRVE